MRALRHASLASAIVLGVAATGVGVASASTHATTARALTSVTANVRGSHTSIPVPPGVPGGIGGDVSAISATSITVTDPGGTATTYAIDDATTVTKSGQSATVSDIAVGDNVRIGVSTSDATLASTIDIVPAGIGGKVTAINGDVLSVQGPNGSTGSIVVSGTTTYFKGGASASLSDITVGSFVFAQGSYGTSATIVDATTVGIGQPGPGAPGTGPKDGGGPPPGLGGLAGPGNATPPWSKGTSS